MCKMHADGYFGDGKRGEIKGFYVRYPWPEYCGPLCASADGYEEPHEW